MEKYIELFTWIIALPCCLFYLYLCSSTSLKFTSQDIVYSVDMRLSHSPNGDIALPIEYEIVQKELIYSDVKTRKQKRKSLVTKHALFHSLVQQV